MSGTSKASVTAISRVQSSIAATGGQLDVAPPHGPALVEQPGGDQRLDTGLPLLAERRTDRADGAALVQHLDPDLGVADPPEVAGSAR